MKLSLNGATTMRADLPTDIRVASEAGFDCVEIWAAKLSNYLKTSDTRDLKRLLADYNIEPYSINSIEQITFRDRERQAALFGECESLCRISFEIGCPYVVVVPGRLPGGTNREQVIEESARTLSQLSDIADRYDVGLAFEFLGQPDCSVQTLALATEIVRQVDKPNIGLVIDTFHFYAGGSTLDSIDVLDPRQVFIFHINDAENLPREELEDRHRLLPGLGILPLGDIVAALRRIGYDRVASVEIFRPEYWERNPRELAIEAHAAAGRVLDSIY